jgi:non-ribosomal peptide synthetase component E (peptide arylation enzyme)
MLVRDILARSARLYPGKPALISSAARLSYRGSDEAANRLANAVVNAGEKLNQLAGVKTHQSNPALGLA